MDPREQALTEHYRELLSRTGEDHPWPDILFLPSHDGIEHVEFDDDGTWSIVVTDRGHETEREHHTDLHSLMFGLCARATWEAALRSVDEPDRHQHEIQDRAHAAQIELMGRIDPAWASELERNYAKWRSVRARMAAADSVDEAMSRLPVAIVYFVCALVVGGAIALVWLTD